MGLVKSRTAPAAEGDDVPELHALIDDLSSAEPGVRRRAARALAVHSEAASALLDRLPHETAPSVRDVMFTSLIKMQSETVVARLIEFLRSEDVHLRNGAIEVLREMPDAIQPFVPALLSAEDSDERIFAVNVLGGLAHKDVPRWLSDVIERDAHINVCAAAVDALAEVGDQSSVAGLQRLKQRFDDSPFMVFAIDTAIARIGER